MQKLLLCASFGIFLSLTIGTNAVAGPLDNLISPVSNPINFEDPRPRTEVRPIFMHHEIHDDFFTGGGDVQLYAIQARFALNDRLAFIATKDGIIEFNPESGESETGFANLAAGFKYAFYLDENAGRIATAGLRYEAPLGNRDVFQGNGDGLLNPFLSAGAVYGAFNFMAGTGLRLPFDHHDSTFFDFDAHVSYRIGDFFPALELNVVRVLDAGQRLPIADEGQDLFNFGSIKSEHETLVTAGPAVRYRFSDVLETGAAYQVPLTSGPGSNITDWRLTADLIYSFSLFE